ncbi:CAAX amino protease [Bacteroidia bacterium]|nr:CAAX amino protease [Bacteroidia bacterium]
MKVNYSKTCTLPQDLIPLLKSRGLSIADEQKAISYLTNIGYYRLSAYLYPLLKDPKTDHLYKPDATFDLAMNMYRFDRKLRQLLFNEVEKVEVAIRSAMSNCVSDVLNDVFWMTDTRYFSSAAGFAKSLALIQSEIDRTKEEFIEHFRNKYSNPFPPAWMITEIIPLGVLCGIYNNMKSTSLKKKVANQFGLPFPVFSSWILTLANLRNVCCHHNRTWNKDHLVIPADLKSPVFPWIDSSATDMKRVYFRICIIKYLLFTVSPNNRFTEKLQSLLAEYPTIDVKAMGFPSNWQNEPLWELPSG